MFYQSGRSQIMCLSTKEINFFFKYKFATFLLFKRKQHLGIMTVCRKYLIIRRALANDVKFTRVYLNALFLLFVHYSLFYYLFKTKSFIYLLLFSIDRLQKK